MSNYGQQVVPSLEGKGLRWRGWEDDDEVLDCEKNDESIDSTTIMMKMMATAMIMRTKMYCDCKYDDDEEVQNMNLKKLLSTRPRMAVRVRDASV